MDETPRLNDEAANAVENLAYRVARVHGGRIAAHHLIPYLPLSLDMIRAALDQMADGSSVTVGEEEGFRTYTFTAQAAETSTAPVPAERALLFDACVACGAERSRKEETPLCAGCGRALEAEQNRLAEVNGWPARAVYEHEILYLLDQFDRPPTPADLAARSRYPLKRMRNKLDRMELDGTLRQELDEARGTVTCHAPPVAYPRAHFEANMAAIRAHPAAVAEDMEIRVTRIALVTTGLLGLTFLLSLILHVPLPVLLLAFLAAAGGSAWRIWKHRDTPAEP